MIVTLISLPQLAFLLHFQEQVNHGHPHILPFSKLIFFYFKIQLSTDESFQRFLMEEENKHDRHTSDVQYIWSNEQGEPPFQQRRTLLTVSYQPTSCMQAFVSERDRMKTGTLFPVTGRGYQRKTEATSEASDRSLYSAHFTNTSDYRNQKSGVRYSWAFCCCCTGTGLQEKTNPTN